jgi:ribose transport system permease protein
MTVSRPTTGAGPSAPRPSTKSGSDLSVDPDAGDAEAGAPVSARRARPRWWSVQNIGAVYIWALIVVYFSLKSPDQFLTAQTAKDVLNQNATTAIAALVLIVPLASGALDLSIGAVTGMGGIVVALLLGDGVPIWLAVVLTVAVCAGLGLLNSVIVVGLRVNALIGTLAMSSVYAAVMIALSDDKILTEGMQGGFKKISQGNFHGVTYPVVYVAALALVVHVVLERAPLGRKIYATGYDEPTARLVGVHVNAIKVGAMVAAASVAGFAGVVTASRVQAAQPNTGLELLMPAVSAAFLGATQIRNGRFNPLGTIIAVLMLGTGDIGLILSGAPQWSPQVFDGVVLIAAVGTTVVKRGGSTIHVGGL